MAQFDLAIIGGGIHGCGIARDAAGRGLSVLLVEQGDLASATSSASTKLIHGGLRYLEGYHFRLVRESLAERGRLMALAPHLVRPMRFVMPYVPGTRPAWMLRLGFLLYDWLGGRDPRFRSRVLDLADDLSGLPLKSGLHLGFEYTDCTTDDARLVIANAIGAREKGASVRPRTRCVAARREDGLWQLILQSGGQRDIVRARALVNAAGPWVSRVLETVARRPSATRIRLVKGSHVVVPRVHAHDRAYLFPNTDGRVVFAIPFAEDFTLIGTTEVDVAGDAADVAASSDEILYLCRAASSFFGAPVKPSRVKWTFSGVRTLVDDARRRASDVSRDYRLEIDGGYGDPPLLTVFGGKLTTYRALAEKAVTRLGHWLVTGPPWTANEPLPGGDLGAGGIDGLVGELRARHSFLGEAHARRLAMSYGTRARKILGDAKQPEDLGARLVADLYAAELEYLRREEWAASTDDVLWRRTKLGLKAGAGEVEALQAAIGAAPAEKLAG